MLDEKIGATAWAAERADDVIDAGTDAVSDVVDDLGKAGKFVGGLF